MKKFFLPFFIISLLVANMAFSADEVHWTVTGPNSVTFDWRGTATEKSLGYGLTSGAYTQVTATTPNPVPVSSSGPFWEANLTGLKANTRYYYSIGVGPERTFRTPPAPGSAGFNVYAVGNIGSSSNYYGTGAVQDIIANGLPSFVVGLGDLTLGSLNGKETIDQHFNDVMVWSKEAAYMPVWGDMEWTSSSTDSFKNYKGRFNVPNSQTSPGSPLAGGKDWYWFDYGNTRFITLPEPWSGAWSAWNTTAGALMAQAQADPNIDFIVTFVHQPAYSSGHYSGSDTLKAMLDTLGDTYGKYVLNVNGHSNNYERSLPQHGITHITAGTGGANLTQDGTCLWLTCTKPDWSAFRAMHLGALKLHFTDSGIEGSFICGSVGGGKNDITCPQGNVMDSFTIVSPTLAVTNNGASIAAMTNGLPIQGFAAASGVTGGAGGRSIIVTNLNNSGVGSLRQAVQYTTGPRIVTFTPGLTGTIQLGSPGNYLYVQSGDLTVDGVGAHITISGEVFKVATSANKPVSNVIVKNLTFANTRATLSAIMIDYGSNKVWVDHNTFYNNSSGSTGEPITVWNHTGGDGLTGITLSWNRFNKPNIKSILVGSTEQNVKKNTRVSIHHNWFNGADARNPRVHGGTLVHMWNNYISNWVEVGVAASAVADVLAENNIFNNSSTNSNAGVYNYGGTNASSLNSTGNLMLGSSSVINTIGTFPRAKLTYSVTPEVANSTLQQKLMQMTGANK